MRNLVRGGIILVVLSLCIYSQTRPGKNLQIGDESQKANLSKADSIKDQESDTKLVKTTGMVRAARAAGASRGSFIATAYCLKGRTAMAKDTAADTTMMPTH